MDLPVATSTVLSPEPSDNDPSRGAVVYRDLKTRLLTGEFPLNVRLGEERLAAVLGVSRTPVRETLKRLYAEGLVGIHPEGGYQPIVPDVVVIGHLYELREGLELQALQRPGRTGERHDPAVLEPLRDEWRALAEGPPPTPDPRLVLLDESFHLGLATASGNGALVDMLRQINERIRIVRVHDFLIPERIEATISEHLALVEAVLANDIVTAESAFSAHLGASRAAVQEGVRTAIARMVTGARA